MRRSADCCSDYGARLAPIAGPLVSSRCYRYTRNTRHLNFQKNRQNRHMRITLALLAPVGLFIGSIGLVQTPPDKPSKPADSPTLGLQKPKAGDKGDKTTDKSGSGAPKFGVPTESEKLLDQAIAKVEAIKKFHAEVRQRTEMLGYSFTAEGQYAIAPDFHLLYELKVQLTNDTTGSIKEVCDGRTHWRNQKVLDTQELVKMDVKKLRDVFEKPQFSKELRDQLIRQLGFSGMAPLMKGLRESQKFESHEEETLNGQPVIVFHGQWRDEVISQSAFRGQQLSAAKLNSQFQFIPNKSTLWVGRDDGWLHKVEFEGSKKVQGSVTKITFEFLNPQIDVDLPDSTFAYEPPAGVHMEDQTDVMYQRLGLLLQQNQGADRRGAGGSETEPQSDGAASKNTGTPGLPALKNPAGSPP